MLLINNEIFDTDFEDSRKFYVRNNVFKFFYCDLQKVQLMSNC